MSRITLPSGQPFDVQANRRGIVAPPFSKASAASQQQVSLTPWWVERPPFAQDFYATCKSVVMPAAVGTIILPGAEFDLPPGDFIAVVKAVTIFVNAPGLTIDVDWTFQINQGPVQGWDKLTTFPRIASNLSIDTGGTIFCPQGAKTRLVATNNSGTGPWTIGGSYTGWFMSLTDIDRVFGRVGY